MQTCHTSPAPLSCQISPSLLSFTHSLTTIIQQRQECLALGTQPGTQPLLPRRDTGGQWSVFKSSSNCTGRDSALKQGFGGRCSPPPTWTAAQVLQDLLQSKMRCHVSVCLDPKGGQDGMPTTLSRTGAAPFLSCSVQGHLLHGPCHCRFRDAFTRLSRKPFPDDTV